MIEPLFPKEGAKPMGPYSPGMKAGGFVFVSGQGAVSPDGKFVGGDIREETRTTLENIRKILEAGGARVEDVVRCRVFLADVKDFAAMNEEYAKFFGNHRPARTTVQAVLPGPIRVEIDVTAYVGE